MFRIKWMAYLNEVEMIETDNGIEADLDRLVYSCIERLPLMRIKPSGTRPDGFMIFNDDGMEVRRWFSSPKPKQKMAQFHIQSSPEKIVFFSDEATTWCKTIPQDERR